MKTDTEAVTLLHVVSENGEWAHFSTSQQRSDELLEGTTVRAKNIVIDIQ